jgi:hypothetical protein
MPAAYCALALKTNCIIPIPALLHNTPQWGLNPSFVLNGKSTVVRGWCPTYVLDGPVYMGKCFLLCSCCRTPTGRGGPRARARTQAQARAWAPRDGRAPRYQQHT